MVDPLGVPPAGMVPKPLKFRPEGRTSEKVMFVAVLLEMVKGMV